MALMTAVALPATDRGFRPGDRVSPEKWAELPPWDGILDPDGEDHWEVISGLLVVSTQPDELHQEMAERLGDLLKAAAPPGLDVRRSPFGIVVPGRHGLGPDGGVKRTMDFRDRLAVPLLVYEIVSRQSRMRDWVDKRRAYAEAGVPSYWIGDPSGPSLSVLELGDDGVYVETTTLVDAESAVIDRPFPVRICPADLVRPPG